MIFLYCVQFNRFNIKFHLVNHLQTQPSHSVALFVPISRRTTVLPRVETGFKVQLGSPQCPTPHNNHRWGRIVKSQTRVFANTQLKHKSGKPYTCAPHLTNPHLNTVTTRYYTCNWYYHLGWFCQPRSPRPPNVTTSARITLRWSRLRKGYQLRPRFELEFLCAR